jgi:prepilin-type N-terminal cleavage/methylation domain-containing protein
MRLNTRKNARRSDDGFTLIEVLVSLTLFSIASIGFAKAFVNQVRFITQSEQRTGAIQAAEQVLDAARVSDPSLLPTSGSVDKTVQIGSRSYVVSTLYCLDASFCISPRIRHITVRVTLRGVPQYEVATAFAQLR